MNIALLTCADCNAERRIVEIRPGITILQILHDDTCPWFKVRN